MGSSVLVVVVTVLMVAVLCDSKCDIKAIFNFGDSNTDTGGFYAAFPSQRPPYGITFFNKPAGRASDGRVITDFLAQAIGIPFLSPYLRSIGSDFRHGVNYATAASTVRLPTFYGISPFSLDIQLNQMKEFRSKVIQHQSHSTRNNGNSRFLHNRLCYQSKILSSQGYQWNDSVSNPFPPVSIFGKALYTIYIGQNDFTLYLVVKGISGIIQFVPQVISQIVSAIKELYDIGGRTFWVLNLGPIGCYPAFLVNLPHNSSDIDEFGCMISYNKAVDDYNNLLKKALEQTRADLPDSSVIFVDSHSVLLDLFQRPKSYGLKYGTKACCGQGGEPYNYNPQASCGDPPRIVEGRNLTATACAHPSNYVSWDGTHTTEAANKFVTKAILNESIFDPPFPLHHLCDLHSIDEQLQNPDLYSNQ